MLNFSGDFLMNQKQNPRIFIMNPSFTSDRISDYMCEYVREREREREIECV